MKAKKLFVGSFIFLTFTFSLILPGCDSGASPDPGTNTGGTDGGSGNSTPGGGTLSGMYYREFAYNENQIRFNSDGSYTWMYSIGTETGTYTVSDNKVITKSGIRHFITKTVYKYRTKKGKQND